MKECNHKYTIERKNPSDGFKETIVFTGKKSDIPQGWKITKKEKVNEKSDPRK